MLTFLQATAFLLAAVLNSTLAYEARANRWKAALLALSAAFFVVMAIHTLWPLQ